MQRMRVLLQRLIMDYNIPVREVVNYTELFIVRVKQQNGILCVSIKDKGLKKQKKKTEVRTISTVYGIRKLIPNNRSDDLNLLT